MLDVRFYETVPPKGGTLTAAGTASRVAWNNRAPSEYRVYAEHRKFTEQCSMFGFIKLVPPKGGTLTAAAVASPVTQNHAELLESRCAVRRKAQKTSVSFFFFFFFRL